MAPESNGGAGLGQGAPGPRIGPFELHGMACTTVGPDGLLYPSGYLGSFSVDRDEKPHHVFLREKSPRKRFLTTTQSFDSTGANAISIDLLEKVFRSLGWEKVAKP